MTSPAPRPSMTKPKISSKPVLSPRPSVKPNIEVKPVESGSTGLAEKNEEKPKESPQMWKTTSPWPQQNLNEGESPDVAREPRSAKPFEFSESPEKQNEVNVKEEGNIPISCLNNKEPNNEVSKPEETAVIKEVKEDEYEFEFDI